MTAPVKYPVICGYCPADLVADGDDLVCPNGHEESRLSGALKPPPAPEPPAPATGA